MPDHSCHYQRAGHLSSLPIVAKCDKCGVDFLPVIRYTCNCEDRATFLLSESVDVGDDQLCPLHYRRGRTTQTTIPNTHPISDDKRQRKETKAPRSSQQLSSSPRPLLDRTTKIGITVLASFILLPVLATALSQIALPSVVLALLGLGLLWALYELLARLFLWPFQDWRAAAQNTFVSAEAAPATRARRWFRHQALFVFLAGFASGAAVVALIAEAFEGIRATILELATISGTSVALAAILFYTSTAVAPTVKRWLRTRGRQDDQHSAERAALRAGLARAMSLGVATVMVLLFVPAVLQPIFDTEFPLATQILVGLVINVVGDVFILMSEGVTKHLWPDKESMSASQLPPAAPASTPGTASTLHRSKER